MPLEGTVGQEPLEIIHSTPFPEIAREGNFLTEGGTDPTRRAPGTKSCNTTEQCRDQEDPHAGCAGGGGLRYR